MRREPARRRRIVIEWSRRLQPDVVRPFGSARGLDLGRQSASSLAAAVRSHPSSVRQKSMCASSWYSG